MIQVDANGHIEGRIRSAKDLITVKPGGSYKMLIETQAGTDVSNLALIPVAPDCEVTITSKKPISVKAMNAQHATNLEKPWKALHQRSALSRSPKLILPATGTVISYNFNSFESQKQISKELKLLRALELNPIISEQSHAGLALGFDQCAPPTCSAVNVQIKWGVLVHIHYEDAWPDIEVCLKSLPISDNLIVTATDKNEALVQRIRSAFPKAKVLVTENAGRDIRPFFEVLESGLLDQFDAVCKIHGKKSVRNGQDTLLGELWRRYNLLDLLVSDECLSAVLSAFAKQRQLGLLGSPRFRIPNERINENNAWSGNESITRDLAKRLGLQLSQLDFFAGSMFWFRPVSLKKLRGKGLSDVNIYAPEAGATDGRIEHGIERLFSTTVINAGYDLTDYNSFKRIIDR